MINDGGTNYILVTSEKDEEKNIPNLIESVINQSIKPSLWVIVNDGSTDKSPQLIIEACKKYKWIKTINLPVRSTKFGTRYTYACNEGFNYAIKYCIKNNIYYNYIGLLDADIIIENNYFEKLINNFINNPRLGIASGLTWSFNGEQFIPQKDRFDEPSGAARLWRRECFEETGYIVAHSADTITNIKARNRSWKTRCYHDIKVKQIRLTRGREGLWKGFAKNGAVDYYLYSHPLYVFFRTLKFSKRKKFYLGLAYLSGYLKSFINHEERISDKETINYFKNRHLKNVIYNLIKK